MDAWAYPRYHLEWSHVYHSRLFFYLHPDNSVVLLLFLTLAINLSKQESGRKQEATGLKEKKGEIVFWRLEQQQELRNSVAEEKPYRQKKKEWGRIKRMETQRQRGKRKDDHEAEDRDASLSLPTNFSCRDDKIVPLRSLRQTSLIWRIRWICETSEGEKKPNVQNALNVFHVWLHFCWHFSSVLINMETKLNLWLLVDFLPLFLSPFPPLSSTPPVSLSSVLWSVYPPFLSLCVLGKLCHFTVFWCVIH